MSLPARLTEPQGKEAELYRGLPGGKIMCTACARLCQIGEGQTGLCGVRGVVNGKLYLLVYGRVMAGHIDPIEKKPVVHYKPGSKIFSIATSGCNWLCHPAGSMIMLSDGQTKSIQEIVPGDMLWSYNTERGMKIEPSVVTHTGSRTGRLWEVDYGSNGQAPLLLTEEHPVLTKGGWKPVKGLSKGDSILRVWQVMTATWKEKHAEYREIGIFHCRNCGETVTGYDQWNRHRGSCYTRGRVIPPEVRAKNSERMRLHNPMRDPEVAKRALGSSKERFLRDPDHGWHRNVVRLQSWQHRHPSVSQQRLYPLLDLLRLEYEREFRIRVERRIEGSKSYYIADAAFLQQKLDVEVDGWWHFNSADVQASDKIRDATLAENGWDVLRIPGSYLYNHPEESKALIVERLARTKMTNMRYWTQVHSVGPTERTETVYSIETVPNHNYVADGILVHNCKYCFTAETPIVTNRGIQTIAGVFDESESEGETGFPADGLQVLSHDGSFRKVLKVFKHEHAGSVYKIRPFYLPELRCTPNHEVFVFNQASKSLVKKRADELKLNDLLAIPKPRDHAISSTVDVVAVLEDEVRRMKEAKTHSPLNLRIVGEKVMFERSRNGG
ncbi:MAG TPA: DUF559 domain-containing protein, partial [Nitrososphaerales archaeon]|nr:DUF559 domain-containing protein [Nitrososphaerales archaeon]